MAENTEIKPTADETIADNDKATQPIEKAPKTPYSALKSDYKPVPRFAAGCKNC